MVCEGGLGVSDESGVEVPEVSSLVVVAWLSATRRQLIDSTDEPVHRQPRREPVNDCRPGVETSEPEIELATLGDEVASTEGSPFRLAEEQCRGRIVDGLLVLLGVVVVAVMALVGLGRVTVGEGVQLFSAVGGTVVGLIGAALGHYFARAPSTNR